LPNSRGKLQNIAMGFLDLFKKKQNPVQEHSARVFRLAIEAGEATRQFMKEQDEELTDTAWFAVVMEFQNLYMQLTDRAIFAHIPETKRKFLMDGFCALCINAAVSTICNDWGAERIAAIQQESMANYHKSLMDYGTCKKLFPDRSEGTGGTMIWEFSKTVAGIVGHEMDVIYIIFFSQLVSFKGLELKKFVEDVSCL
jgi:hypothetical protein